MVRWSLLLLAPISALLLAACEPGQNVMALSAECGGTEPDAAITACNSLLQSNGIDGPMRARTLVNRANAKAAKQDFDAAIADFSESIKLAPETASTFVL